MRLPLLMACLCLPLVGQEKPPAQVDEALHARVSKFYQAHVEGKFRLADQLVAAESKDFFFEMEKQRYLSFDSDMQITYSENFSKAKVITNVSAERRIARMGVMVMKQPMISYWKLIEGEWFWYHYREKYVDTPFGRAVIPDEADIALQRKVADFKKVSPSEILGQVKLSASSVTLSGAQGGRAEIGIANDLPGQIVVDLAAPAVPGLTVSVDKKVLKGGERAKLLFNYKASGLVSPPPITVNVVIQPLNQTLPITVTFAGTQSPK